jgi:hypothetical protein
MTLKKFREAFVLSRAKDDAKDALYLARLLLTDYTELTPWQPEDPATRLLQQLVTHRRAVVDERTGLSKRLIALLKQYFPHPAGGRSGPGTPLIGGGSSPPICSAIRCLWFQSFLLLLCGTQFGDLFPEPQALAAQGLQNPETDLPW